MFVVSWSTLILRWDEEIVMFEGDLWETWKWWLSEVKWLGCTCNTLKLIKMHRDGCPHHYQDCDLHVWTVVLWSVILIPGGALQVVAFSLKPSTHPESASFGQDVRIAFLHRFISPPGSQVVIPEKAVNATIQNNCNCLTFGSLKCNQSSFLNGIPGPVMFPNKSFYRPFGGSQEQLKSPKNYFRWRS